MPQGNVNNKPAVPVKARTQKMQRIHIPTKCETYGDQFWHGQYSVSISKSSLAKKAARLRARLEKYYGFEIRVALAITGHFLALRTAEVNTLAQKAAEVYSKVNYACA